METDGGESGNAELELQLAWHVMEGGKGESFMLEGKIPDVMRVVVGVVGV